MNLKFYQNVWFFKIFFKLVFQDSLATTKFKVSTVLTDLLIVNHQEQQKVILDTVVNKLGDPDHQVSSRIIYQVKNLCNFTLFDLFRVLIFFFSNQMSKNEKRCFSRNWEIG